MILKVALPVLTAAILAGLMLTPASSQNKRKKSAPTPQFPEAPAAFDNKSNGMVEDATHTADQAKFDDIEKS